MKGRKNIVISTLNKKRNLTAIAEILMKDMPPCHDARHVIRVVNMALFIAMRLPSKIARFLECVEGAALFHDVDDHKFTSDKIKKEFAMKLLKETYPETYEDIWKVASNVSWSKYINDEVPDLKELNPVLWCVREADWIDASGPIGIARCFSFGALKSRSLEDSLKHFDEKLLKMKDHAKTDIGKTFLARHHEDLFKFANNMSVWLNFTDKADG